MVLREAVEIELAKLLQRVRIRLKKHEAPSAFLLQAILDCLSPLRDAPLACCKITLQSMDMFLQLITEYDPSEHVKPFCLCLAIIRRLARIGGKSTEGRVGFAAEHDLDQVENNHNNDNNNDEVDANGFRLIGVIERLIDIGIIPIITQVALNCAYPNENNIIIHKEIISLFCEFSSDVKACTGISTNTTNTSDGNDTSSNLYVGDVCDNINTLPSSIINLLSSNERLCKRSAILLLSSLCSDPVAKYLLINTDANTNNKSSQSRAWISNTLPLLWHMLLDSDAGAAYHMEKLTKEYFGTLSILSSETISDFYLSLFHTEVGDMISYILSAFILASSDVNTDISSTTHVINKNRDQSDKQSQSHTHFHEHIHGDHDRHGLGQRIISDRRYTIALSGSSYTNHGEGERECEGSRDGDETDLVLPPTNPVLVGVHIVSKIIEEIKNKQNQTNFNITNADNETVLSSLRHHGVFKAMYLCYLKQNDVINETKKSLLLLHEQVATAQLQLFASNTNPSTNTNTNTSILSSRKGIGGDKGRAKSKGVRIHETSSSTSTLDEITQAYRKQMYFYQDVLLSQDALKSTLNSWIACDEECFWDFRILLQQHGFHVNNNNNSNDIDVDGYIYKDMYLDIPLQILPDGDGNGDGGYESASANPKLDTLIQSIVTDLQPSSRLSSLKTTFDQAINACNVYQSTHTRHLYVPAIDRERYSHSLVPLSPSPSSSLSSPRTNMHVLEPSNTLELESTAEIGDTTGRKISDGMLGYLLLKRLYERNGMIPYLANSSSAPTTVTGHGGNTEATIVIPKEQQLKIVQLAASPRKQYDENDSYRTHSHIHVQNYIHNHNHSFTKHHHDVSFHDGTPLVDEDLDQALRILEANGKRPMSTKTLNAMLNANIMNSSTRRSRSRNTTANKSMAYSLAPTSVTNAANSIAANINADIVPVPPSVNSFNLSPRGSNIKQNNNILMPEPPSNSKPSHSNKSRISRSPKVKLKLNAKSKNENEYNSHSPTSKFAPYSIETLMSLVNTPEEMILQKHKEELKKQQQQLQHQEQQNHDDNHNNYYNYNEYYREPVPLPDVQNILIQQMNMRNHLNKQQMRQQNQYLVVEENSSKNIENKNSTCMKLKQIKFIKKVKSC